MEQNNIQYVLIKRLAYYIKLIHVQIYKGSKNYFRYQLTDNIFIKLTDNCLEYIYDVNTNQGLVLTNGVYKFITAEQGLKQKGFHVNINSQLSNLLSSLIDTNIKEALIKSNQTMSKYIEIMVSHILNHH